MYMDNFIKLNYMVNFVVIKGMVGVFGMDLMMFVLVDVVVNFVGNGLILIKGLVNLLIEKLVFDFMVIVYDIELINFMLYLVKYVGYLIMKGKFNVDLYY